jgi:hypothetical protein
VGGFSEAEVGVERASDPRACHGSGRQAILEKSRLLIVTDRPKSNSLSLKEDTKIVNIDEVISSMAHGAFRWAQLHAAERFREEWRKAPSISRIDFH